MSKNKVITLALVIGAVIVLLIYTSFCLNLAKGGMKKSLEEKSYTKYFYYEKYDIYSCLTYYSNKNENTYELIFSADGEDLKLTYMKPDKFKGMTLEIGNKEIVHINPYIDKSLTYYTTKEKTYNHLLFTDFAKNYLNSEETSIIESEDGKYLILGVEVPGSNYYFKYQELFIKKDTLKPQKLVVKNKDGMISANVSYDKFTVY